MNKLFQKTMYITTMLLLYHLPVLITNFVTPYGKLQGAYYPTEGSSIVTSQKENELTILVDYGQLYENLDKLLKLNTTEYTTKQTLQQEIQTNQRRRVLQSN